MTRAALVRVCRNPVELLRLVGQDPPSPAWGAVLRGFYGSELEGDELTTWRHLTGKTGLRAWLRRLGGERDVPAEPPSVLVACCGRRSLKTSGLVAWLVAFEALAGGHEEHALPGSEIFFAIVAPTQRQAGLAVRAVRLVLDMLAKVGVRYRERASGDRTEIEIVEPKASVTRVIAVMTAAPEWLRGYAIPVLVLEEAGHFGSEDHQASDREILAAARPSQLQFPDRKLLLVGTPGPSGSVFESYVTKPPNDAIVIRGATWDLNPRISEETCRREAERDAIGDVERYLAQEYRAARFGSAGESFLDTEDVRACVDVETCAARPIADRAVGLDVGLVRDATAIVRVRAELHTIRAEAIPVTHVVVEVAEEHRAPKGRPLELPDIMDRVAGIADVHGSRADVVHDQHIGPEVQRQLGERGLRSRQVPMDPKSQERRWRMLAELIRSKRLHLPDHGELVRQIGSLKITQLSSGAHRVEGKRDDLVDALALAVEVALSELEPCAAGEIFVTTAPLLFSHGSGLRGGERQWFRRDGGRLVPIEPPRGTPEWDELVERAGREGWSTPAIEAWRRQHGQEEGQR